MPYKILAEDNEFGVASGKNVDAGTNTSTFDGPPAKSVDLVITSQEGDQSPEVFSVGDTYDVSVGGEAIKGATVVRSDDLGTDAGAVVFEGTDQDGAVVQVVWSPNFDLQSWYDGNESRGYSSQFYNEDRDSRSEYDYVCLAAETQVETAHGWARAAALRAGDLVQTARNGLQEVVWVGHRQVALAQAGPGSLPVLIQPKALTGGHMAAPVIVSALHRLLLASGHHGAEGGQRFMAPAKAFAQLPGVRFARGRRAITYVSIMCRQHEVLNAQGLAVESFLPGAEALRRLAPQERIAVRGAYRATQGRDLDPETLRPAYPCLGGAAAGRAIKKGALLCAFDDIRVQPRALTLAGGAGVA